MQAVGFVFSAPSKNVCDVGVCFFEKNPTHPFKTRVGRTLKKVGFECVHVFFGCYAMQELGMQELSAIEGFFIKPSEEKPMKHLVSER